MENNGKLTEENIEFINKELQEVVDNNENLKVLADLPSNNGVEYHEPEKGEAVKAEVTVNSDGEKIIGEVIDFEQHKSNSEKFVELGKAVDDEDFFDFDKYDITLDDVKGISTEDSSIGSYDISDQTTVELFDVIKKYKAEGKIRYSDLPEEIKHQIDTFISKNGIVGDIKRSRNLVAETLISEYISNIELSKINSVYQEKLDQIYTEMGDEISPIFKDYNESRGKIIEDMKSKVEDEDKKKLIEEIADAINDSYKLTKFKELASKAKKLKKFDFEKPTRVFEGIERKYENSKYKFYQLTWATNVLHKHLVQNKFIAEDDKETALRFVLTFCKVCSNFKVENPVEHSFMFYTIYNIILLDIYKNEQYEEFAGEFLKNVMDVISVIKK